MCQKPLVFEHPKIPIIGIFQHINRILLWKPAQWVPESDRNSLLLSEQGWIGLGFGCRGRNGAC